MSKQLALYVAQDFRKRVGMARNIKSLGFELHRARTLPAAKSQIKKYFYNLVLIEFDNLDRKTFDLCSSIRAGNTEVILIVLMTRAKINAEEKLFDLGATDIVAGKQASSRLLIKRIRAHLHNNVHRGWCRKTIRLKDTVVDFERREVWCNGGVRPLPGILADLLKYFVDNPGRVISRKELLQSPIWADSICTPANEGGKTFDVNMSKLRKLIESDPHRPQLITSVRGEGWKLAVNNSNGWQAQDLRLEQGVDKSHGTPLSS